MSKSTIYLSTPQKEFMDACKKNGITYNFIFNMALNEFIEKYHDQVLNFSFSKESK